MAHFRQALRHHLIESLKHLTIETMLSEKESLGRVQFYAHRIRKKLQAIRYPLWLIKKAGIAAIFKKPLLTKEQRGIVTEMRQRGYAVRNIDMSSIAKEFEEAVGEEKSTYLSYVAERKPHTQGKSVEWFYYYSKYRPIGAIKKFIESLQPIASAYLKQQAVLTDITLHSAIPTETEREGSSHWHRDRGDFQFFRAFLYVDTIDNQGATVSYIPFSQRFGKYHSKFFNPRCTGSVITSGMNLPSVTVTGKSGTVLFCDTGGIHANNNARSGRSLKLLIVYATKMNRRKQEYLNTIRRLT